MLKVSQTPRRSKCKPTNHHHQHPSLTHRNPPPISHPPKFPSHLSHPPKFTSHLSHPPKSPSHRFLFCICACFFSSSCVQDLVCIKCWMALTTASQTLSSEFIREKATDTETDTNRHIDRQRQTEGGEPNGCARNRDRERIQKERDGLSETDR